MHIFQTFCLLFHWHGEYWVASPLVEFLTIAKRISNTMEEQLDLDFIWKNFFKSDFDSTWVCQLEGFSVWCTLKFLFIQCSQFISKSTIWDKWTWVLFRQVSSSFFVTSIVIVVRVVLWGKNDDDYQNSLINVKLMFWYKLRYLWDNNRFYSPIDTNSTKAQNTCCT